MPFSFQDLTHTRRGPREEILNGVELRRVRMRHCLESQVQGLLLWSGREERIGFGIGIGFGFGFGFWFCGFCCVLGCVFVV